MVEPFWPPPHDALHTWLWNHTSDELAATVQASLPIESRTYITMLARNPKLQASVLSKIEVQRR